MKRYDVIWIGTGQATGTVVPELRATGKMVAVIEEDRVGGTCVNWGCTPTKTLVAAAKVAHTLKTANRYGFDVPSFRVDFPRVMARMNDLRNEETHGFTSWLDGLIDLYHGHATFASANEVRVGDEVLWGATIYIHTGTRAAVPPIPGLNSVPFLDNKGLLALTELPEHLIMLGGSYIALEFAQIFRRFGSQVTVIQRAERLVSREDPEVSASVLELLSGEGIEVIRGAEIQRIAQRGLAIEVDVKHTDRMTTVRGSHLFVGLGRTPNSDRLDLDNAGVSVDNRGFIVTDERLQTNVPHIFALGDVNGRGSFTHTSVHDGQILLNQLKGGSWTTQDRVPIHAMFLDPPLARVGLTQTEAVATGRHVLQASRAMSRVARAREKGETHGFIKLLIDGSSRTILGATIFGVGGDEVINMVAAWISSKLTVEQVQKTVLVHPTVSELLPWILQDLELAVTK